LVSVDDPGLHPGAKALGTAVDLVRKQDLRPDSLRKLWEAHGNSDLDRGVGDRVEDSSRQGD
jgi:hypothetical protein